MFEKVKFLDRCNIISEIQCLNSWNNIFPLLKMYGKSWLYCLTNESFGAGRLKSKVKCSLVYGNSRMVYKKFCLVYLQLFADSKTWEKKLN